MPFWLVLLPEHKVLHCYVVRDGDSTGDCEFTELDSCGHGQAEDSSMTFAHGSTNPCATIHNTAPNARTRVEH